VFILEHHADELVIDIDFGGIGDLAALHLDAAVVEGALQVRLDALQIVLGHGVSLVLAPKRISLGADPREAVPPWEARGEARASGVHGRRLLRSRSHRRCRTAYGPSSARAWRRSGS